MFGVRGDFPEYNVIYAISFAVTALSIFVKGYQYKNIAGNHFKSAFFTSFLMYTLDMTTVGMFVKEGWTIIVSAGSGASFGIVLSMYVHNYIHRS